MFGIVKRQVIQLWATSYDSLFYQNFYRKRRTQPATYHSTLAFKDDIEIKIYISIGNDTRALSY